jgi:transcriptional regulator with XRE-family HTH domain
MAGGDKEALGRAIATVRRRLGMTQQQVAAATGVPQVTLSRWENGAHPSLGDIARLEEGLGIGRGAILREAGYVADAPRTVAEVIDSDPTLDDRVRGLVWSIYRQAQGLSADLRSSSGKTRRPRGGQSSARA